MEAPPLRVQARSRSDALNYACGSGGGRSERRSRARVHDSALSACGRGRREKLLGNPMIHRYTNCIMAWVLHAFYDLDFDFSNSGQVHRGPSARLSRFGALPCAGVPRRRGESRHARCPVKGEVNARGPICGSAVSSVNPCWSWPWTGSSKCGRRTWRRPLGQGPQGRFESGQGRRVPLNAAAFQRLSSWWLDLPRSGDVNSQMEMLEGQP